MAKRKDGYEGENGGKFYSFAEKLGDIHITHSTYDSRLLPHNHDFIEILCITEGEGIHRIGSNSINVRRGDFFLIDKGVSHTLWAKDESLCWINCIFRPEILDPRAKSAKELFLLADCGAAADLSALSGNLRSSGEDIAAIFSDMLREYDKKSHGYEDILLSYLKIIINKIERKLLTEKDESPKQRRGQLLFDGVMAEVESAPAIDHKEKDFAERFYMSPAAFSAGFKRYSGISFASFLSSTRIKEAIRLLQEEDIPISAVQALSGYKDSKSFYRAFKRYTGTTPANYRNKH
jgi:AraC-like DNA-binding protein